MSRKRFIWRAKRTNSLQQKEIHLELKVQPYISVGRRACPVEDHQFQKVSLSVHFGLVAVAVAVAVQLRLAYLLYLVTRDER